MVRRSEGDDQITCTIKAARTYSPKPVFEKERNESIHGRDGSSPQYPGPPAAARINPHTEPACSCPSKRPIVAAVAEPLRKRSLRKMLCRQLDGFHQYGPQRRLSSTWIEPDLQP